MQHRFRDLGGAEKMFVGGMVVWFLLQLTRAVAIVLIQEISAGAESMAWLYPAYLDLFAVVFALPGVWATVAKRNATSWALILIYWAISIVDHGGNFVTTTYVGPPVIAEGMGNPYLVPAIQAAFDLVFGVLLMTPRFRELFFHVSSRPSGFAD